MAGDVQNVGLAQRPLNHQVDPWKLHNKHKLPRWKTCTKAFMDRMDADEKIKAFLDSDRCTKMENPDNTPLSKAPLVQVNSFM